MSVELAEPQAHALFLPDILAEPHDALAALRSEAPVAPVSGPDGQTIYLVTAHALIEEASRRAEDFSSQFGHMLISGGGDSEIEAILMQDYFSPGLLLVSDDPEHKRYRALVNNVFAQGRIANMAPRIEQLVDELIDDFIERGTVDFVNEFAILLPTYVIADILGLPRDKYRLVRQWSDAIIGIVSRMGTREQLLSAAHQVVEFRRFILETIRARRVERADDLISALIDSQVEGFPPLTDEEIAPLALELSVAGNETTRNTLMSGMVRLIRHPDQLEALRADPSLVANAVEELLRYETPASAMWRIATRDTSLGGVDIPAGAALLLRYDAGNRDPRKFEDPDRFDIARRNARMHQAFGGAAIHRCLGQMLARKEMQIAFPRLLGRLRDIRIDEARSDTAYWPGLMHRGISALQLDFTPAGRANPAQSPLEIRGSAANAPAARSPTAA